MPLKEFIIKKLSLRLNTPERTIDAVLTHQFVEAFQATTSKNTVELSGFGKFVFNQKKAHRRMEKYITYHKIYTEELLQEDITEERKRNLTTRLNSLNKNIEHLKPKLK